MFSILGTILIGFVVGLIARALHPGEDKTGFWLTVALGVGGAFLAKLIGGLLGFYHPNESAGFVMSILGAVLILFIFNVLRQQRIKGGF
ncbi:MAG: hypothetical protein RLY58_2125 [Pseudomonadota bacterium]|jgi:uncharacterized membrane protein YeaQ/YmgE (transglycosylase-associated protein family)